jgi:ABC-type transporter Mla subunit MlaD
MKRSEFKAYIREEVISTLSENTTVKSDVERYIAMLDELKETFPSGKIKAKASALIGDLLDYINMNEASKEEVENQKELNKALEKTAELTKDLNEVDEDDDEMMDKKATKAAKKGDSISKLASKLGETDKELKSTVKKWKNSEEPEKSKLLSRLKELTKIKKELEGLL